MPIEGNSEESQEEAKSESEVDSVLDFPTESLDFEEEPDNASLALAKCLCVLAEHIQWSVSIRKIVYRGISEFEQNLEKQFKRYMEAHLYDGLCSILKIKVAQLSPPYKRDRVARRKKRIRKKIIVIDEARLREGMSLYAQEVGHDLPEDFSPLPLQDELIKKFWFSSEVKKLAKKARHIGWMDFTAPSVVDIQGLMALCIAYEKQKEEREIIRLRAKLKKISDFDLPAPEGYDASKHYVLIAERERLEQQISFFEKMLVAQKKLPLTERDEFPFPALPLKELPVENYIDEVHLRYSEIQEQTEKRERIFRLLRIAVALTATVSFCIWQINLRYEIEDLQLRSAQIGLKVTNPIFPYTNQQVSDIRYFVELQEELYPKMNGIRKRGIKKGLKRIPFRPPYTKQQYNTWALALESFQLQRIPAGRSSVGSPYGFVDERPVFTMVLSRDVFFMDGEVTQALYRAVMGVNPNVKSPCLDCPVTNVRWIDAIQFTNRLSEFAGYESCYHISEDQISWDRGISCLGFRLPTEGEWEYAASAQSDFTYSGSMDSSEVAWFNGNSGLKVQPVRTLLPNDFAMYDMNGNAWEWCWDRYGRYEEGVFQDPIGSRNGINHVIRGGSYQTELTTLSARAEHDPDDAQIDIGFRVVRTAVIGNVPQQVIEEK